MYKTTAELKSEVKESLKGRWGEAITLSIVPIIVKILTIWALIAASFLFGSVLYYVFGKTGISGVEQFDLSGVSQNDGNSNSPIITLFLNFIQLFLTVGISFTFLDVIRRGKSESMQFKQAFRLFNGKDLGPVLLLNILMYIFNNLWYWLFIIPGFIKSYSYSQANFIYKDLSENSDTTSVGPTYYITESRHLMNGHKKRLFWLDITFLGWYILSLVTFGLAEFFVTPYVTATKAAFYNDLAKDKYNRK
ncbi:DUF975 family protein [Vagococcus vulneris]|uniref:DUF975 family protein n=1 Tax=Vagococcus vulneris TaxID=1977869 RepID=UPI0014041F35|nr:DUF975 family protein [Vagococcus vulneris]